MAEKRPPSAACLLASLADVRLSGLAPGLTLSDDGLVDVDPRAFKCCEGRGVRLLPDADLSVSCGLTQRLRLVRALAGQHARIYHEHGRTLATEVRGITPQMAAPTLQRLAKIAAGEGKRGLAYVRAAKEAVPTVRADADPPPPGSPAAARAASAGGALAGARAALAEARAEARAKPPARPPAAPGAAAKPSAAPGAAGGAPPLSIWAVAIAAAWRFGLVPHVVTLGHPSSKPLPAPTAAHPSLILVEDVSALWDVTRAETFDHIVGYAYGAVTPLFLDILVAPKDRAPDAGRSRSTRRAFDAKIAGVRARSPLSWLTPDCVSKLTALTEGLEVWRPKPVEPEKPRPPRLPW